MASKSTDFSNKGEKDPVAEKLAKRYYTNYTLKEPKLNLMQTVARYVDPDDQVLTSRASGSTKLEDVLFDTDAQIALEKSSKNSIADVVNPYEAFFTLNVPRDKADEQVLQDYKIRNQQSFHAWINDSPYKESLVLDKWYHDLYGFSAMTLWSEGGKLMTYTEDPFKLVFESGISKYEAVYWVKYYTLEELKDRYDFVPEGETGARGMKFAVLCCLVPNNEMNLGSDVRMPGKRYAQIFLYLGNDPYIEGGFTASSSLRHNEMRFSTGAKEIGKREHFDYLPTVVNRDTAGHRRPYGNGYGRRILVIAQNLNEIKRGMIRLNEYSSNPPLEVAQDVIQAYRGIQPGRVYPRSAYGGEGVRALEVPGDLEKISHFYALEMESLQKAIPNVNPPQKKARQSAVEIQQLLSEVGRNQFIYKIRYLKNAVAKHLEIMFKLALSAGVIEKPPEGLDVKEITPSLSNLIAKEMKRNKARAYVEALQLSQGYLALDREALDEINTDAVVRKIFDASGAEDILNTSDVKNAIREEREKQQQAQIAHQRRLELLGAQQQGLIAGAQTEKLTADAAKARQQALGG